YPSATLTYPAPVPGAGGPVPAPSSAGALSRRGALPWLLLAGLVGLCVLGGAGLAGLVVIGSGVSFLAAPTPTPPDPAAVLAQAGGGDGAGGGRRFVAVWPRFAGGAARSADGDGGGAAARVWRAGCHRGSAERAVMRLSTYGVTDATDYARARPLRRALLLEK